MQTLTSVIVEDEAPVADELKYLLSNYDFISIKGMACTGEQGLDLISELQPDVVFMDINMPGISGMDLAAALRKTNSKAVIIFVTAYENHAVKAFELEALDYVLKPFDDVRIHKTMNRIITHFEKSSTEENKIESKLQELMDKLHSEESKLKKLPCENYGRTIFIDVNNICFCHSENDKTFVKTKDKEYNTIYNLSEIAEKTRLIRIHRSFVINVDSIQEFYPMFNYSYKVVMNDNNNTEIPVSRNKLKDLKNLLGLS